jgi:DNA-binding response OmpR family regulator
MASNSEPSRFAHRLSELRHDLRNSAGHVLGYSEMLKEDLDDGDQGEFAEDLDRIHSSGERLLELVEKHMGPNRSCSEELDIAFLQHQMRIQLNHVAGYCEILEEAAEEHGQDYLIPDLGRIATGVRTLLQLIANRLTLQWLDGAPPPAPTTGSADDGSTAEGDDSSDSRSSSVIDRSATTAQGEGGEILVVDDDPLQRELLQRRLQKQGYEAKAVDGGKAAFEFLADHHPDVILLDMMMPEMPGIEVLRRLKNDRVLRNLPVIMLSGLDDMEPIIQCILMGAEDYLFKPFNPVLLKARLSATLEKHRLRQQQAPKLRVFISSPGDVQPERRAVRSVIDRLNEELSGQVFLVPILWEDEPLLASQTAQTQIASAGETDIYVGIFWARMGTPLPAEIKRPDGTVYDSGSEFEYEDAINSSATGDGPDILVYRKLTPPMVSLSSRDLVLDALNQKDRLETFFRRWFTTADGKSIAGVYHAFDDIDAFEKLVHGHLKKLVLKRLATS